MPQATRSAAGDSQIRSRDHHDQHDPRRDQRQRRGSATEMTAQTTRAALYAPARLCYRSRSRKGGLGWQLPSRSDEPTHSSDSVPPPRERSHSGHIGLIVLGSIVAGLVLGLVLVLGVFGGSEEATITGAALIALGAGMLILFLLAGRSTDQPQPWALAPAIALGGLGFALLIIRPGDRVLGLDGLDLADSPRAPGGLVGARRAPLASQLVEALAALSGACRARTRRPRRRIRDGRRGVDQQPCPLDRAHLPRRWTPSLPELRWRWLSNRGALQRTRRANAELGLGAERSRSPDPRLCLRPCGPGLERQSTGTPGRAPTRRRPSRASLSGGRSRPLRRGRSLRRWHVRPRLRDGLPEGDRRSCPDRFGVPAPVRRPA